MSVLQSSSSVNRQSESTDSISSVEAVNYSQYLTLVHAESFDKDEDDGDAEEEPVHKENGSIGEVVCNLLTIA